MTSINLCWVYSSSSCCSGVSSHHVLALSYQGSSTQSKNTHLSRCPWNPSYNSYTSIPLLSLCAANAMIPFCQAAHRPRSNSLSLSLGPVAATCIDQPGGSAHWKLSTLISHTSYRIVSGERVRIQQEPGRASCSCWRWWRRASSAAGRSGCWGPGPSWQTPSSPWWSGGGFLSDSRGKGTWSTRRAPGARSNDTARRDGRRTWTREQGGERSTTWGGMKVKSEWRDACGSSVGMIDEGEEGRGGKWVTVGKRWRWEQRKPDRWQECGIKDVFIIVGMKLSGRHESYFPQTFLSPFASHENQIAKLSSYFQCTWLLHCGHLKWPSIIFVFSVSSKMSKWLRSLVM